MKFTITARTAGTAARVGAAVALAVACAPIASALPPGGAATSNTAGTSSSISPTELAPCDTLYWEVSGFAPNEVVNVKFDDGALSGGDASVQGQGVVSQAVADSSGRASNSVQIPCDFPEGNHWLRMLASQPKYDDSGKEIGSLGYTLRTDDFTVVRAHDSSDAGSDSGSDSASGTGQDLSRIENNREARRVADGASNAAGGQADSGAVEETQRQVTRRTVTRVADAPAAAGQAGGSGQSNASGQANGSGQSSGSGHNKDDAKRAQQGQSTGVQLKTSNDVLKATGTGKGNQADGVGALAEPEPGVATYAVAQGQASNGAPIVGLAVGGSILVVGLSAVAAYLYVNRRADAE